MSDKKILIVIDDNYANFDVDIDLINLHQTNSEKAKFIAQESIAFIEAMLDLKEDRL